jgi:hypothetical protein
VSSAASPLHFQPSSPSPVPLLHFRVSALLLILSVFAEIGVRIMLEEVR